MEDQTLFDPEVDKAAAKAEPTRKTPTLIVLEGPDVNRRFSMDRPRLTIGRDPICDLTLDDPRASRMHAEIVYENYDAPDAPPLIVLTDLGSANGVRLNGAPLDGPMKLADQDRIQVGKTILGFHLRDETSLKAEQRLVELASSDALTGLRNRAYFEMELEREYQRSRRYGRPLSLVLFDIDHFKLVNDTYGHPAGDATLREIGRMLTTSSRTNDVAARFGGEEFTIILPETPLDSALIHARRLRQSVEEHTFEIESMVLRLTISVGVSGILPEMTSAQNLIKEADKALYVAKRGGRNRVCWHGQEDVTQGSRGEKGGGTPQG